MSYRYRIETEILISNHHYSNHHGRPYSTLKPWGKCSLYRKRRQSFFSFGGWVEL